MDMECAAVAALAQFRGKAVFQFFHGSDCLDGGWEVWGLSQDTNITGKDKAALLALELAVRIG